MKKFEKKVPKLALEIYLLNLIKIAIAKNINNTPITIKAILIRFVIVEVFEFETFETLETLFIVVDVADFDEVFVVAVLLFLELFDDVLFVSEVEELDELELEFDVKFSSMALQ